RNKSENERSKTKTGSKITVPTYGIAAMQHVAQVTTHATTAVANASTIQNKQYNNTSPGCAAINLVTTVKPSGALQRRRYMIGTMKLEISDHPKMRKTITQVHPAIADIRYTL